MTTMRPHPPGWHKDEDAEERCLACSHPEAFDLTPEDDAFVKKLVAEGWKSTSNKYRHVARVHTPKFEHAITFADEVPQWIRDDMRRYYDMSIRFGCRSNEERVERLELTVAQFHAFKKAGGHSA